MGSDATCVASKDATELELREGQLSKAGCRKLSAWNAGDSTGSGRKWKGAVGRPPSIRDERNSPSVVRGSRLRRGKRWRPASPELPASADIKCTAHKESLLSEDGGTVALEVWRSPRW